MNQSSSSVIEHSGKQGNRNAVFENEREKTVCVFSLERSKIVCFGVEKLILSELHATDAQASLRPDPTAEELYKEQVILTLLK